ncbi:MAG: type II toxin-antitoxin system HicB family antitoxin [Spirochaetes bacterium]|nr:type II toxin-antitoxin system HicB family antitoxin [Spirochaetota bacterium]
MHYHFKIHKEDAGYWASCVELKGCNTQADTIDQLNCNMKEALNLFLNEPDNSRIIFPMPHKHLYGKDIVEVPVEPKIAFAIKMKLFRHKKGLSQRQVADLLGMKNIYSYQRLESTRKANPNISTIARIKEIFPDFKIDDIFIHERLKHKNL